MKKISIILFNDFNMIWSQEALTLLKEEKPAFVIETNKKDTLDINRYSLEIRYDHSFISACEHYCSPSQFSIHHFDPEKEIPVIQLDEESTKEVFSTKKK